MSSEYLNSILQDHKLKPAEQTESTAVRKADKLDSPLRWRDETSGLLWPHAVEGRDGTWMRPNATGTGWTKVNVEDSAAQNLKFIQTEPKEKPAEFAVSIKNALPYPTWANPGDIASSEDIETFERQMTIWAVAGEKLRLYLRFLNRVEPTAQEIADFYGGQDWPKESAEIAIGWLKGQWAAKGITQPTQDQLKELAAELKLNDEKSEAQWKEAHAKGLKAGEYIQ